MILLNFKIYLLGDSQELVINRFSLFHPVLFTIKKLFLFSRNAYFIKGGGVLSGELDLSLLIKVAALGLGLTPFLEPISFG
jgi:hypothetical protein